MFWGPARTGFYYPPWTSGQINDGSNGGQDCVDGDAFWHPVVIWGVTSIGITRLAFQNNNTTANNMRHRLGIYEADDDGVPATLLVDAGTVTKNTNSPGTLAASTGSPFTEVTLSAGTLYYIVTLCEVTHNTANFWRSHAGHAGFRYYAHGAEGSIATDVVDYAGRGSNNIPIVEGVTTGSEMPSTFVGEGYPQVDESSSKTPPLPYMYINTVTA